MIGGWIGQSVCVSFLSMLCVNFITTHQRELLLRIAAPAADCESINDPVIKSARAGSVVVSVRFRTFLLAFVELPAASAKNGFVALCESGHFHTYVRDFL